MYAYVGCTQHLPTTYIMHRYLLACLLIEMVNHIILIVYVYEINSILQLLPTLVNVIEFQRIFVCLFMCILISNQMFPLQNISYAHRNGRYIEFRGFNMNGHQELE